MLLVCFANISAVPHHKLSAGHTRNENLLLEGIVARDHRDYAPGTIETLRHCHVDALDVEEFNMF